MAEVVLGFVGAHFWEIVQALAVAVVTAVLTPLIQNARARRIRRRLERG